MVLEEGSRVFIVDGFSETTASFLVMGGKLRLTVEGGVRAEMVEYSDARSES